jgi:hypothetical protein
VRAIPALTTCGIFLGLATQMANNIADILSGSNDEDLLHQVYTRIQPPRNPVQKLFVNAWELSEFVASDGFEILFEQDRSIDEFSKLFADIGFPEALPIFAKVKAVVPDDMLAGECDSALHDHLANNFDRLKELLHEYLDIANARLLPAFGQYVRDHKEDFADQLTQAG